MESISDHYPSHSEERWWIFFHDWLKKKGQSPPCDSQFSLMNGVGPDWSNLAAAAAAKKRKWSSYVTVLVTQSCLTLCDSSACSLPGSSVHGIIQARIWEWVANPCSRRPSQPRDGTWISSIAGRFFTFWASGRVNNVMIYKPNGTPSFSLLFEERENVVS